MNAKRLAHQAYDTTDRFAEHAVMRITARLAMLLLVPLVLWMAREFIAIRDDVRDTRTNLQYGLSDLRERTGDRYTGTQASRDWQHQVARDARQDTDRARIERRVENVERVLRR